MFMAGKSTFRRPASPDPELRLFSVKPVPAVPPTPLPNTSSSPAPSSITSHRPSLSTSNSTSSSKRRRSPSPPTNRRDESVSQPSSSRGRSRERALHEPHHHSPSPPPILPDLQSTRKPHDRPTHSVGPFDEGKDTVLYTQSDPLRGHFVRTPGAWYETRTHYPMPRRHWGRSDSFSPPPGPNHHLQPTRESFKSARGEHDEELRINQYYWVGNSFIHESPLIFFLLRT